MVHRINNLHKLNDITKTPSRQHVQPKGKGRTFDAILSDKLRDIRFSEHAADRLRSRNIVLDADAKNRLIRAVDEAEAKGAKDALVLVDDIAMVVSIKNRTVVTALQRQAAQSRLFTNIDSAVIT